MSEKKAMVISGHRTRSCFDRYHIVSLDDIQEGGEKMDRWVKEQSGLGRPCVTPGNRLRAAANKVQKRV
jgi:hypothetical protein